MKKKREGSKIRSQITEHRNRSNNLFSQKVSDFDPLSSANDLGVDWEVRVHHSHNVSVLLRDTDNHVIDMGGDGSQGGDLLGQTEEQRYFNLLSAFQQVDGDWQVPEVPMQFFAARSDCYLSGFHLNLHVVRNDEDLVASDRLHF